MTTKTSASQIGITLFLFQLGSAPLYLLGGTAKQDAWISIILAALAGFFLLLLHLQIFKMDEKQDLFDIYISSFGKVIGGSIAFLYIGYFFYESIRVVRDLGEIVSVTLLNRTPISVVLLVTLTVIAFVAHYGPRVFFRFCGVFLYVILFAYFTVFTLICISGLPQLSFMLPVMENGFNPILQTAFPDLLTFPFGQTILFLTLFKYATDQNKIKKTLLWSYTLVSILLLIINQVVLLVLGPQLATLATYPLYTVVQLIQVGHAVERSDVFFTLILFIGLFIKINLYYITIAIGLQRITKIKYKVWINVQIVPVFLISIIFPNYIDFMFGKHVTIITYIFLFFQIVFPVCLFAVMLVQKKRNSNY
ncbi:spore germination protein [Paenibacillus sp. LS1]|uniref:GerAB/ArcD/ProY family transporter n=1 Tax=Paenibacillus sp. LS1 TaxID=2992120 RepID=UPI00222E738A|nr:spore germination protein [Paenibacillus sp. LS1]MCW3792675.1 spore germination protein [Paenibacillus sp. LS1]